MDSRRFIFLVVPFVVVYHFFIVSLAYFELNHLTPHVHKLPIVYHKTVILSVLLPGLIYIIKFIHQIFTLSNGLVPHKSNFKHFYFPLIEEVLKLGFICIVSSLGLISFKQLAVFTFVFNSIELVRQFYALAPMHYTQRYAKFLQFYEFWTNQESYRRKYSIDDKRKIERIFETIVGGEEFDFKRDSFSSFTSEETLINNKRISIYDLPPTFNMNNFEPPKKVISTPMEIDNSHNSVNTSKSVKTLSTFKSCYDLVDKLYSVSPKNTFHLNTATAIAALEPSYEETTYSEPDLTSPAFTGSFKELNYKAKNPTKTVLEPTHDDQAPYDSLEVVDPLASLCNTPENIDEEKNDSELSTSGRNMVASVDADNLSTKSGVSTSSTNFGGGGGGNFKLKLPDGTKLKFGGGMGGGYSHSHSRSGSESEQGSFKSSKFIGFLNFFSWLLPTVLPITNQQPPKPSYSREAYPLLKRKLSTYTINCHGSYDSIEQETGIQALDPTSRFESFKYFISYYFDYSLDDNRKLILIDPLFEKFGLLVSEANLFFVIADLVNLITWNVLCFWVYGNFVIDFSTDKSSFGYSVSAVLAFLMVVSKLFKLNYLHELNNHFNYKLTILAEFIINSCIAFAFGLSIAKVFG